MADFKLATSADDIRVWDCNGYTLIKQFNPHTNDVSSIAWSQDNNFIASTSAAGDKVSITCIKSSAFTITDLDSGEDRTCVAFNSNSRYLLSGGKSGTLAIWDLKTQKMKKQYKDHTSGITSLTFNWNDTYIASGAENGDIILYNVVTAHGSQPMTTPDTQAIRQLEYSHFKKALLGAASDDGVVNLWDTNTRRLLHSFTQMHCASVTGLSFSPLNEMLMMSVGLDKRIICYDVIGKTGVKTMTADSPLTSIDIHPDGATLAIGTAKGKVLIYDLRYGAHPIHDITAHKSAVQSVKFMNNIKTAKDDSSTRAKSTRLNQIRKLHSASTSPRTLLNGDVPDMTTTKGLTDRTNLDYSAVNRSGDKSTGCESEVISPYKDASSATKAWETNNTSASENKPDPSYDASVGEMGVFSPLAANGSTSAVSYHDRSSLLSSQSPRLVSRSQSRNTTSPSLTNGMTSSPDADKVPLSDPGNSSSSESQSSIDNNSHVTRPSTKKMTERMKNSTPRETSTPISEITSNYNNNLKSTAGVGSHVVKTASSVNKPVETVSLNNNTSQSPRTVLPTRHVHRKLSNETGVTDWRAMSGAPSGQAENESKDVRRAPVRSPRSDRGYESSLERGDSNGNTLVAGTNAGASANAVPRATAESRVLTESRVPAESRVLTEARAQAESRALAESRSLAESRVQPESRVLSEPRAFQMELVQSMIAESMEEFQDQMKRDMMKLHVDMLRQFQIQQAELLNIVKEHSVNEDLLSEIYRLREENKRLKKTF